MIVARRIAVWVVSGFLLWGAAGCATFAPDGVQASRAPSAAYQDYIGPSGSFANGDSIKALLSYTSSDLGQVTISSWSDVQCVVDARLEYVARTGKIAPNYPAKALSGDLHVYKTFTSLFIGDYSRSNVRPTRAAQLFASEATALIFGIMDYDYRP